MRAADRLALSLGIALVACGGSDKSDSRVPVTMSGTPGTTDTGSTTGTPAPTVNVTVTLDGVPVADAVVMQAGGDTSLLTDASGQATVDMDDSIDGDRMIFAWVSEARNGFVDPGFDDTVEIGLVSIDASDNEAYTFQDPGTPYNLASTEQCAHCHVTINGDWWETAHQRAASNPVVQDLYAGTVSSLTDSASCTTAGGSWWSGLEPGSRVGVDRCYLGDGVLPDLNPACGDTGSCDSVATEFGACADCHAPGIDGVMGGRDLLEATGHSYDYGIHCDVCHKVESTDPTSSGPGIAGKLRVLRPSEPDNVVQFEALSFGPYIDVGNPVMGSSYRSLFRDTTLCAGCHEYDQPALVPGTAVDPVRWPAGTLPIHSTWEEWRSSVFYPNLTCRECHMPSAPERGNSGDLDNIVMLEPGLVAGWRRPAGEVRAHTWEGPRDAGSALLQTSMSVVINASVTTGTLTASIDVQNAGAGHAVPTGEPMRAVVLVVKAECSGTELVPTGGDAVPDFGGHLGMQDATGDWALWPGAQVGDQVRVVARSGGFYDYVGVGPFGDGTFDAAAKGMPVEQVVGSSTVTAVVADAVTFDQPLPAGDIAYLVRPAGWPVDGGAAAGWAGHPGFAFGKVLTDAAGRRGVAHHAATDVASDNRLLLGQPWTSTHEFTSPCAQPVVTATLIYRPWAFGLAEQKGWAMTDTLAAEVVQ